MHNSGDKYVFVVYFVRLTDAFLDNSLPHLVKGRWW